MHRSTVCSSLGPERLLALQRHMGFKNERENIAILLTSTDTERGDSCHCGGASEKPTGSNMRRTVLNAESPQIFQTPMARVPSALRTLARGAGRESSRIVFTSPLQFRADIYQLLNTEPHARFCYVGIRDSAVQKRLPEQV